MFFIRADANSTLGSGHVMRSMAIAKELRTHGQEVTFITADLESEGIIKKNNFSMICLESVWNSLEVELPKFKRLITQQKIQAVLIDSYFATKKYLEELKELVKVIIIDDLNQFVYPADMIINYHIYAQQFHYEQNYPKETKLLTGCSYVPLREEFIGKTRVAGKPVTDVLITTGGSDSLNIAGQLINSIRTRQEFNHLTLHIAVGPLNKNIVFLEQVAKNYQNIQLHQNIACMSELMLGCDIAISAGGSTLYELCACGVPTISFSYADNQLPGVNEFDRQGIIPYAGEMRDDAEGSLNNVINRLSELSSNIRLREKHSLQMKELVDGFGACRISEVLLII